MSAEILIALAAQPINPKPTKSITNKFFMFLDRKSTRLNSSHLVISYAVFCLKKKKISEISKSQNNNTNLDTNIIYDYLPSHTK